MCVPRPCLSCDGVTGSVWIRFVSMSVTELRGDVDGATISPMLAALFTVPASCSVHVTLIRHGQTEWNVAGRLQGASDSALTARGVQQATACGRRLCSAHFDAIYTSPLPRARRTAELVGAELNAAPSIVEDERLRERSFGDWEGLPWATIQLERAEELKLSLQDPAYAIPGGGESRSQLLDRALGFLDALPRIHADEARILIVTHSATSTALIKHVLGLRPEQRRSFDVRNLAINTIESDSEDPTCWMLRTLGDCAHLEGLA